MEAWMMWLAIAVIAFVFEAMTAGLTTIWFAISALAVALLTVCLDGIFGSSGWFLVSQVIMFIVLSVVLLVLTKPISRKLIRARETNALSIIGKKAVVSESINNVEGKGQIKLNGNIWTARSEEGMVIEKEKMVEVIRIEGVTAIVKEMK